MALELANEPINWARIARYAAMVFAAQFVVGFAEGLLTPQGAGAPLAQFLAGKAASFLACAAIFAHLAHAQATRTFAHAALVFLLAVVAGLLVATLILELIGSRVFLILVAVDYVVLFCALLSGTLVGRVLRQGNTERQD